MLMVEGVPLEPELLKRRISLVGFIASGPLKGCHVDEWDFCLLAFGRVFSSSSSLILFKAA